MLLEERVAKLLILKKKTLCIVESCSGGLLSHRLTNIPGASRFLKLGLTTYSNEAKTRLLKISEETLQEYGAVSQQVASLMAQSAQKILKTDFGVSITGIAGPDGGTKMKPIGTTFIAIHTKGGETVCLKCLFEGTRANIKKQATTQALKLLNEFLT